VWHNDFWRHNLFLGEVTLPLDKVDWSNPSDKWYGLEEQVGFYVVIEYFIVFNFSFSVIHSYRHPVYS